MAALQSGNDRLGRRRRVGRGGHTHDERNSDGSSERH
jgi:hypothetical protein